MLLVCYLYFYLTVIELLAVTSETSAALKNPWVSLGIRGIVLHGFHHIFTHIASDHLSPAEKEHQMGVSENSVPLNPMVNDIIPIKWL